MKLKEDLTNNAGDKTNTSANNNVVVHQKQVKQKLLQAQQEEALFVKTSSALQSKMEKVDQQISQSMNGYHLGLHLKKDASANHIAVNPKCPMESTNHNNHSNGNNDNNNHHPAPVQAKKANNNSKNDEDIASSYFQAKYGSDQDLQAPPQPPPQQPPSSMNNHRSQSVGFNGNNRSTTQTPERDIRASSQAPSSKNNSKNNSRRPSFSYLSLLSKDGSMPHRTQPIGSTQTSRRNSTVGSQDHLNNFAKPNLMVRNNPIGLPEPSVKRDGYAVGKDGSFYRSSENLFENNGAKNGKSTSATPDRDLSNGHGGNRRDQRRSSTSSTGSGSGVRAGGGLIETGRPVKQSFLPFGSTMSALASKPNYVISKKGSSRSRSQSQSRPQQQIQKNTNTNSTNTTTSTVQNPSLVMTCTSSSASSTMSSTTMVESTSTSSTSLIEQRKTTQHGQYDGIAFEELDVALKQVAAEDSMSVEVTLPRKAPRRARSLSRNNTETLPDENVTISLPSSKHGSRQPSMDRENSNKLTKSSRSESMEIFTGVYEITVPCNNGSNKGDGKSKQTAAVNEIHSDTIRLRSGSDQETTAKETITLKATPSSKHSSRESLAMTTTTSKKPKSQPAMASTVSASEEEKQQKINKNSIVAKYAATSASAAAASNNNAQNNSTTSQMTLQQKNNSTTTINSSTHSSSSSAMMSSSMTHQTSMTSSSTESTSSKIMAGNSNISSSHSTATTVVGTTASSSQNSTNAVAVKNNDIGTVVQGQKFNITNSLKKTSHHNSQDDLTGVARSRSRHISGTSSTAAAASITAQQTTTMASTTKKSRQASGSTVNGNVVGCALKGLDAALEALAKEQKAQEKAATNKYQSKSKQTAAGSVQVTENGDGVTSVTVSLPSSKRASARTSRRGSISEGGSGGQKFRSRRNSIDLYSADYNIKLGASSGDKNDGAGAKTAGNSNQSMKMMQRSSSHIKIDDIANSKIKLCPRCHSPHHTVNECTEFGNLKCPRCFEWSHWEDSCWTVEDPNNQAQCETCQEYGHHRIVHDAADFRQRRAIVDTLGWEPFQNWFYESSFRSWWQLNGLVGVPLYRIYKRKNDWKSNGPIEPTMEPEPEKNVDALSIVEKAAALAEKYSTQYSIKRDDSTDELLKSVHAQREARKKQLLAAENDNKDDEIDSGRSTPEHLKKYSGCCATSSATDNTDIENGNGNNNNKRLRTFSETLKMLDDDILQELDVK